MYDKYRLKEKLEQIQEAVAKMIKELE